MQLLIMTAVFMPFIMAVLNYIIGKKSKGLRDYVSICVTVAEFAIFLFMFVCGNRHIINLNNGVIYGLENVCVFGIHFVYDGFRSVYCLVAALMWMMTTLFSREYFAHYRNRNRYHFFLLITLGATIGVFLSADFYTTFIFFEIMSLTSFMWVVHDEKKEALRAGNTYLAVAVIGGLVMLMGLFLLYDATGTLYFSELTELLSKYNGPAANIYGAGICILFGFMAKAGAFPLHIWLPKAHPVAPAPASALLSGILTKAGVFGIIILSLKMFIFDEIWGVMILCIGVITMFLGALLALFSVDLKRTLACSSVSQIGFILTGIGATNLLNEENALAAQGSLMHMVNHSLIKLVLFMCAGVVYMNVHKLNLDDVKGFGRNKPLLHFLFLSGALAIAGIPGFSGYISKTLIHEGLVEYYEHLETVRMATILNAHTVKVFEWIFLLSGGLTLAYMTKLYVCVFVEKNNSDLTQKKYDEMRSTYISPMSKFAITVPSVILLVLGAFPDLTLEKFGRLSEKFMNSARMETIDYMSAKNLNGAEISIVCGILIYLLFVRNVLIRTIGNKTKYLNRWNKYFDLENLIYRPFILGVFPFVFGVLSRIPDSLVDSFVVFIRKTILKDAKIKTERTEGNAITEFIGGILNKLQDFKNLVLTAGGLSFEDYEHKLATGYDSARESFRIITRGLSFGLILFCIGLLVTFVYLLYFN